MQKLSVIISNSETAFHDWKKLTAWKRAELLKKWHDLILANRQKLAELMNKETGKTMEEANQEVDYSATFIAWSAEEAKRIYGEIIPTASGNKGMVIKQPVGVVAAITPWNFPAAMITRKVAPALAAGCTVICKPSEESPKTAQLLQALAAKAGIPEHVFQVVTGDAQKIGEELCASEKIRKLSFTGSTEVGKLLLKQCAGTVKKVTMELGGNAPFIIFDDADFEKALAGAIKSRFRNSGQTCICANRIFVHEKIYDKFAKQMAAQVKPLKIGRLINEEAVAKVARLVKTSGGKILCGGKFKGKYFEPTVLADVKPNTEIFATEIFGPVATLIKFKSEAEVVQLANSTNYGLAAFVFTADAARGMRVAEALEFGMVGVNDTTIATAHSPFGGVKQSGIGREGSHYGLEEFLEVKFIGLGS